MIRSIDNLEPKKASPAALPMAAVNGPPPQLATEQNPQLVADLEKDRISEGHQYAEKDPEKDGSESDADSQEMQDGVKRVEAITQVWSRTELVAMFVL